MAIVKSIEKVSGKKIPKNRETTIDYNADNYFFSIWSYRDGDIGHIYGSKQNMQFNKEMAKKLRNALNAFLQEEGCESERKG